MQCYYKLYVMDNARIKLSKKESRYSANNRRCLAKKEALGALEHTYRVLGS